MSVSREDVLAFLKKKTRKDLSSIGDDAPLFSGGTLDSFLMIDLMTWLDKKTGGRSTPDDMDDLDTIAGVVKLAASRAE